MPFKTVDPIALGLPPRVKIVEVGARDGLQNEPSHVDAPTKAELVHRLVDAGTKAIEVGAFVSPKWVPQMATTAEVFKRLQRKDGVAYSVLVPNMKGLEQALTHGCKEVAVFAAASGAFSQWNINCSIGESLDRYGPVIEEAARLGIRVRGYVSCAIHCPFSGPVSPRCVADVASALYRMGCYEISLSDTTGAATPSLTRRMIETCAIRIPVSALAGHFHDSYGMASANIYASLQSGISVFDCAISGLGGCPYSPGETGNVATEDVVYLLHGLGIETGLDMGALLHAGDFICAHLGKGTASRTGKALRARHARDRRSARLPQ